MQLQTSGRLGTADGICRIFRDTQPETQQNNEIIDEAAVLSALCPPSFWYKWEDAIMQYRNILKANKKTQDSRSLFCNKRCRVKIKLSGMLPCFLFLTTPQVFRATDLSFYLSRNYLAHLWTLPHRLLKVIATAQGIFCSPTQVIQNPFHFTLFRCNASNKTTDI